MKKVLTTIKSCHKCDNSVLFVNKDADFHILACNKTRRVLMVVPSAGSVYHCNIPEDCPLPDFIEPKTD